MTHTIPGYRLGDPGLATSPLTLDELALLKETLLFDDEDTRYLEMSKDVLAPAVDEILDVWYGFVASKPHLVRYFSRASDGAPDADYLGAVRRRFGQWILDTATARHDQEWLDYQHEIGLRHHRTKKNETDGVASVDHIHFRYLPALFYPIVTTLKPFLERSGASREDVDRMHQAWTKSVLLQVILWSYPYVTDGDF